MTAENDPVDRQVPRVFADAERPKQALLHAAVPPPQSDAGVAEA